MVSSINRPTRAPFVPDDPMRVLAVPHDSWNVWRQHSSILGNESSGRTKWESWPYQIRVLAVPVCKWEFWPYKMRVLAAPDESTGPDKSSNRTGMQMRVLALHDESTSRTIPMRCFVGPRCCLLPHVVWFACLRLLWGVGPIATIDTLIMGSLSVCLCDWLLCLYVFFIRNQLVSIHMYLYMYRGLRCSLLLQCPT